MRFADRRLRLRLRQPGGCGGIRLAAGGALLCGLLFGCSAEQAREVIDCSVGPCVRRPLYRSAMCGEAADISICSEPKAVFDRVRLVADANNHVAGPITEAAFDVEIADVALTMPWDLEFLPDGSMLITERGGAIQHLVNGSLRTLKVMEPMVSNETGLLGLAIDPDFSQNGYVYIYYTYGRGDTQLGLREQKARRGRRRVLNRVSRLRFRDGTLYGEEVLLDRIPGSVIHSGGRLEFGPDGKLYITTGDAGEAMRAWDPEFLAGKILRLERDGSIPLDNPFPENPVYSRGHRNPQGLAWHPDSGDLYASEHGYFQYDEVNRIHRGENHGWAYYRCDQPRRNDAPPPHRVVFPIVCFDTFTMAPSGMTFVSDPASPWHGSLFLAGLRGRHLRRFEFSGDEIVLEEIFYVSEGVPPGPDGAGGIDLRLRDVEYRNGALWVIGDGWGLAKLTPSAATR